MDTITYCALCNFRMKLQNAQSIFCKTINKKSWIRYQVGLKHYALCKLIKYTIQILHFQR